MKKRKKNSQKVEKKNWRMRTKLGPDGTCETRKCEKGREGGGSGKHERMGSNKWRLPLGSLAHGAPLLKRHSPAFPRVMWHRGSYRWHHTRGVFPPHELESLDMLHPYGILQSMLVYAYHPNNSEAWAHFMKIIIKNKYNSIIIFYSKQFNIFFIYIINFKKYCRLEE